MSSPIVLVIEVGGTNLRAALFDPATGTLSNRVHADAPHPPANGITAPAAQTALLRTLQGVGLKVLQGRQPDVVSIAYPGPIDNRGVVLAAPTVLGALGSAPFPLQLACEGIWPQARVAVMNDLTAAGYRYAARTSEDFCVITIGSGIGHKVFIGGEPQLGPGGRGGEIGHLQVDPADDAMPCDCGGRGHLGAIASGRGNVRLVQRRAEQDPGGFRDSLLGSAVGVPSAIDGPSIAEAFGGGDAWVRSAIEIGIGHLGRGLAAIHLAVGVERFIVVGGFAFALGEPYRASLARAAEAACWQVGQEWDEMISFGIADDDQGMMGAGIVAVRTERSRADG
jgi:C7-cyclitol 7-kinase